MNEKPRRVTVQLLVTVEAEHFVSGKHLTPAHLERTVRDLVREEYEWDDKAKVTVRRAVKGARI